MTSSTPVDFASDSSDPFLPYAVELIEQFCGFHLNLGSWGKEADVVAIYHGNDRQKPCRLRIPWVEGYSAETIPRPREMNEKAASEDTGEPFPFDIFAALRFWLADEGHSNASPEAFDDHERLRGRYFVGEPFGLRDIPVVNFYLILLRNWIQCRLGFEARSHLPEGKRCIVVLSHDVDNPINYGDPSHALEIAFTALRQRRLRLACLQTKAAAFEALRWIKRPGQKMWLFREVMAMEVGYGFRSTFFFAPTPWYASQGSRFVRAI